VSPVSAWAGRASALLAALLGTASAASAQTIAPAQAPVAWVAYAEEATATVSTWLAGEGEAETRVRAELDQRQGSPDAPSTPIEVRLWIAADGRIERIGLPSAEPGRPGPALESALVGRWLAPPPRDILLPLRVCLSLEVARGQPPCPQGK
jgi:hypothetical protein